MHDILYIMHLNDSDELIEESAIESYNSFDDKFYQGIVRIISCKFNGEVYDEIHEGSYDELYSRIYDVKSVVCKLNDELLHKLDEGNRGEVVQSLETMILCPDFDGLTNNIIHLIFLYYTGMHGREVQELAEQCLENMIEWSKTNTPPLNICTRLGTDCWHIQAFPCMENVEKLYLNMKNYPELKVEDSEIRQRNKAIFRDDFLSQFEV